MSQVWQEEGKDSPPDGDSTRKPSPLSTEDTPEYDFTINPLEGLPNIADDNDPDPDLRIGRSTVDSDEPDNLPDPVVYRAAASDPIFGYLVALAVSFGTMPLLPDNAALRYTVVWGILAIFGVTTWLLGNMERIGQEKPDNLVWGVLFGVVAGTPLYLFGGETLSATAQVLFREQSAGTLLAYLLFVMPLGETLFFRGVLQQYRGTLVVGGLATIWSSLLFFPLIGSLREFWAVAVFIGTTLAIVNVVYSWVRERNGLAAAWLCQIIVNMILIYLPFISR
jgi:membrane protease YdiL (CAAX protease family)